MKAGFSCRADISGRYLLMRNPDYKTRAAERRILYLYLTIVLCQY
jgi:hypothetical protein